MMTFLFLPRFCFANIFVIIIISGDVLLVSSLIFFFEGYRISARLAHAFVSRPPCTPKRKWRFPSPRLPRSAWSGRRVRPKVAGSPGACSSACTDHFHFAKSRNPMGARY
jgi:hypothetical protein|tara:strand:+ start:1014 stop:1343 length:330 start_codon:yes stop_codon:yes gene_type:complete